MWEGGVYAGGQGPGGAAAHLRAGFGRLAGLPKSRLNDCSAALARLLAWARPGALGRSRLGLASDGRWATAAGATPLVCSPRARPPFPLRLGERFYPYAPPYVPPPSPPRP